MPSRSDFIGTRGTYSISDLFVQRASAAFRAIAVLRFAERTAARALPPFLPPFRPIVAKYSEIERLPVGDGSPPSVASFTVKAAALFGSDGILLKRLMHLSIP
jgi:hypothetical protein